MELKILYSMIKINFKTQILNDIQGVLIKSGDSLKQYYSTTKRLAEDIKTVLES